MEKKKQLREQQFQAAITRESENKIKLEESKAAYENTSMGSEEEESPKKVMTPERPMTAAEQRKQKLLERRLEAAEKRQANLRRLHEQREAKIASLDAKLEENVMTGAQRVKEMAKRQRAQIRAATSNKVMWQKSNFKPAKFTNSTKVSMVLTEDQHQ